jgi:hypothetical protein
MIGRKQNERESFGFLGVVFGGNKGDITDVDGA